MELTPRLPLERYLLEAGILSDQELALAQKVQRQQRGPLLMVLLALCLIDLEQVGELMGQGYA